MKRSPLRRKTPLRATGRCAICRAPSRIGHQTCSAACAAELLSSLARAREARRRVEREARAEIVPGQERKVCKRPGCQNALVGQATIYCSPRCHYADRARAGTGHTVKHYHRCCHCGTVFVWRKGRGKGVYCSAECNRANGALRRDPDVVEIVEFGNKSHRRADFVDDYPCCRNCGRADGLETHHSVYRQHIQRAGGDRWHPDTALRLCRWCHAAAHASLSIPLTTLRDENITFAFSTLGPSAYDYLNRHYAGDDPRVAAALAAIEAAA